MEEIECDIQEVKRLKRRQLVQVNLVVLLAFFLSVYYVSVGLPLFVFFGFTCLLLWILFAHALYTLTTGKMIGTKTSKLIQAFERNRSGERRWKRKQATETTFIGIVSIICTVLVFNMDLSSETLEFMNLWPFIGAWIGSNIGAIIRTSNLQ